MDLKEALRDIESLSHAYGLEGGVAVHDSLLAHLASIGFDVVGHPDAVIRIHEQFGIDESRDVIRLSVRKPIKGPRTIFVIVASQITAEAQHALLKTLEDPQARVTFFLITPSLQTLLPTLRSRLLIISNNEKKQDELKAAEEFVQSPPAVRIKMLAPLLDERKPSDILNFLANLEKVLAKDFESKGTREGLEAVYRARKYALDKGALLKVLLEQVALLTPTVTPQSA